MQENRSAAGQPLPSHRGRQLIAAGLLWFAAVWRLAGSLGQRPHIVPHSPARSGSGHTTAVSFPCSVPKGGKGGRGDLLAVKIAERFFSLGRNILNIDFFF